jgi:hypothetical protein
MIKMNKCARRVRILACKTAIRRITNNDFTLAVESQTARCVGHLTLAVVNVEQTGMNSEGYLSDGGLASSQNTSEKGRYSYVSSTWREVT